MRRNVAVAAAVAALLLALLLLQHYGGGGEEKGSGLLVVLTFPGIEADVRRVLCSSDSVVVLVPAGADPHEYTLRPSDVALLEQADIVVTLGHTALDKRVEEMAASGSLHAVVVNVVSLPGMVVRVDPSTGKPNLHGVVYDPANYGRLLAVIAERAATLNPQCSAEYRSRVSQLLEELDRLSRVDARGLRLVAETPMVQYAVEWTGARVVHVVSEPETPLSPSRLARAEQLIESRAVDAVAVVEYSGGYSRVGRLLAELAEKNGIPVISVPSLFLGDTMLSKLEHVAAQISSIVEESG